MFFPATGEGRLAFAPAGGVSVFTTAVIRSLVDGADSNELGNWEVTNESLAAHTRGLLLADAIGEAGPQAPPPNVEVPGVIHVPRALPRAAVIVDCDPDVARPYIGYCLERPPKEPYKRQPDNSRWSELVEPGMYRLQAIAQPPYKDYKAPEELPLFPPRVTKRRCPVS